MEGAPPSHMPKATPDLRSLARSHTQMAVQTLAGIARNGSSEQVRVAAAIALLDRAWGRPAQIHSDADGGAIQIVIRQAWDITGAPPPVLIEQEPDFGSR